MSARFEEAQGPTPYAVICREHGKVYLTTAAYDAQMARPDSLWCCPRVDIDGPCGAPSEWDDANYEAAIGGEEV